MKLLQKAKELAYRAHARQVDKAGRPYIEHVSRVAQAVSDDAEAEAVAWLHDVMEDQRHYIGEVLELIPPSMMWKALLDVTRGDWISVEEYYQQIRSNPLALKVKLADIADNSDESRLALLDMKTADRLRRKYAKAFKALS